MEIHIAIELHNSEYCTQCPWPKFSRWNFWSDYFDTYWLENANIAIAIRNEVGYLPSETKSGIFHQKRRRVFAIRNEVGYLPSETKSGICHRVVPLWLSYIVTLTNIFKITKIKMWQSRKRWEPAKMFNNDFYSDCYLSSWNLCEWCTLSPWSSFQGETFSCYLVAITIVQAADACRESHGSSRGVTLVV